MNNTIIKYRIFNVNKIHHIPLKKAGDFFLEKKIRGTVGKGFTFFFGFGIISMDF
jgi:hypothetical protein